MPLANSLVGIPVGSDVYLGVKMSDGSRRIVSYDGTYPLCTLVADGDDGFNVNCVASPGIREEQPAVVPFRFSNTAANAPAGYETLSAELVFTSYNYYPDEALASWSADMYVSGVKQVDSIQNGDPNIVASGEPIAVEGDVQIFGDSNCLTYPSGEPGTVYARINTPIGFGEFWQIDGDDGKLIAVEGASSDNPKYYLYWITDWAWYGEGPIASGEIKTLNNIDPFNVDGYPTTFTKP